MAYYPKTPQGMPPYTSPSACHTEAVPGYGAVPSFSGNGIPFAGYPSAEDTGLQLPPDVKAAGLGFSRAPRTRINALPMGFALFVPSLLFCYVAAVMSFWLHYLEPGWTYVLCGLGFLVVVCMGLLAVNSARRRMSSPKGEHTWFMFLFITCLLAWCSGMLAGDANFYTNMQPFYDVSNLDVYTGVDPGTSRGEMLMDAGRIVFNDDARLDLKKSIGFMNTHMYCVAPVSRARINSTSTTFDKLANYDFWAVGMNCCSSNGPDFHCGQFSNPHAHGGLRLMEDDERAFYRLAVQQAEAAYKIKAMHPLFFHWVPDPVAEVNAFQEAGYRTYVVCVCSFFALQVFLVATAAVVFSKLDH